MISYTKINIKDAESLQAIWSDPEVIKYTGIFDPCSMEQIQARIARFSTQEVFTVREDNVIIGVIGCPAIDIMNTRFGIFYQFRKSVWGQGYAKRSVEWLLDHMKKFGDSTIYADVITDNIASEKILQNNGFELKSEANVMHRGNEVTVHNYELTI